MLQAQNLTVFSSGMRMLNLKRPQWQLPLYSLRLGDSSIALMTVLSAFFAGSDRFDGEVQVSSEGRRRGEVKDSDSAAALIVPALVNATAQAASRQSLLRILG